MPKLFSKVKNLGLPPGTLEIAGPEEDRPVKIRVMDYSADRFEEKEIAHIEDSFDFRDTSSVTWINVDGRNAHVIHKINEHFGIHPLVLEDILSVDQRPKIEDCGEYVSLVLRMLYFDSNQKDIFSEQVSLIFGKNYVLSFQEKEGDVFDAVRERIRFGKGRVRQMGADYLSYCLIDAIIDYYFVILEKLGERVDILEGEVIEVERTSLPREIHMLKKSMIFVRKQIWPLREVLNSLLRNQPRLMKKTTEIYLRDAYDNTIQIIETVEALRESLSGLHDIYLSLMSNRMNEIMKVLTIFAAIFIPLTFLAGIYGMNFNPEVSGANMPELNWKYGYLFFWILSASTVVAMLSFFKSRKWI